MPLRGENSVEEKAETDAQAQKPLSQLCSSGLPRSASEARLGQMVALAKEGHEFGARCSVPCFFTKVLCRLINHSTERCEDNVGDMVNALS